jgi:hypothetical protein
MARNSCLDCVRKHVASAAVFMDEAAAGYPFHRWYAVGHLEHAESECRLLYPKLSASIRESRLAIIEGSEEPDFDLMILSICKLDDPNGDDLKFDPRNSKKFEGFA